MITKSWTLGALALLALATAAAAQPAGTAVDRELFEISGTVAAFTVEAGVGVPTLVVAAAEGSLEVRLGPAWYVRDEGFQAAVGDRVHVVAFDCLYCTADAVAVTVENLTAGLVLALRTAEGVPLWRATRGEWGADPACDRAAAEARAQGRKGGKKGGKADDRGGKGRGFTDQCRFLGPDVDAAVSVEGVVADLDIDRKSGGASLTLTTGAGDMVVLLMPFQPLVRAGLLLKPDMELVLVIAPWPAFADGVWVALSVTDPATGLTVQLRDPETGAPLGGGPGGR